MYQLEVNKIYTVLFNNKKEKVSFNAMHRSLLL